MLQSLGRLFISSSRCEWYIGEILSECGIANAHTMQWSKRNKELVIILPKINAITGTDCTEIIMESQRLSEELRIFRNELAHNFLGKLNNANGWIELKDKLNVDAKSKKLTIKEVDEKTNSGDLSTNGYKHVLLALYHANGKI